MDNVRKYLDYVRGVRRYSERTCEIYSSVLEEFMSYSVFAGGSSAQALVPENIRNYEVYLLDDKAFSPRTVNLHLSVLSGFSRYMLREGLIKTNPVRLVTRPRQPARLPEFYRKSSMEHYLQDTAYLADEDAGMLVTGDDEVSARRWEAIRNRLIINLLYKTGIRRSELVSLTVGAVDCARNVIRVTGKGDKTREIPLAAEIFPEISLYLDTTVKLFGHEAADPSAPLFITSKGAPIYPVAVDRVVKKELGASGITGRKSPHVLRHTLATQLLDEGARLNSIKEMLGHSSLAATQVYTHNSVEKLKNVYNSAHPRAKRQ